MKLICITGIDGSGKSTLIDVLSKSLSSFYVANIWDLFLNKDKVLPFKSKKDIDEYLCLLTPDSRLLFLAHTLKYSIDKAFLTGHKLIIADSYYYKYFATELALDADPQLARGLQKSFPEPEIVIELDLPVQIAATRKKTLSRYECGLSKNPCATEFIDFQQKAKNNWKIFEHKNWHCLDGMLSPEENVKQAMTIINL
jgi:thymidylate kinase